MHCYWEHKWCSTWENSLVLPKIKHRVTIWPSNFTLRYILKRTETYVHTKTCKQRLPWWSSGWDPTLPTQGAQVRSLVRELDPACHAARKICVFWLSDLPPDDHPRRGLGALCGNLLRGASLLHNGQTMGRRFQKLCHRLNDTNYHILDILKWLCFWRQQFTMTAYKSKLLPFILISHPWSVSQTRREIPLWQTSVYTVYQKQKLKSILVGLFLLAIYV